MWSTALLPVGRDPSPSAPPSVGRGADTYALAQVKGHSKADASQHTASAMMPGRKVQPPIQRQPHLSAALATYRLCGDRRSSWRHNQHLRRGPADTSVTRTLRSGFRLRRRSGLAGSAPHVQPAVAVRSHQRSRKHARSTRLAGRHHCPVPPHSLALRSRQSSFRRRRYGSRRSVYRGRVFVRCFPGSAH